MIINKKLLAAAVIFGAMQFANAQELPLYLNTNAPLEDRVQDALSRMTIEEKCRLTYAQSKFSSPGVPRLGIPELWMSDGPHGVRMEINWNDWGHSNWTNDSITAFPALTCLAATWDPEMGILYGKNVGEEARYRRKSVLLGPGVNIYRTPLNGRNFEYMGEDPYLASVMCVPYIQGLQSNGVACCVKHYALNDQEEFRNEVDVKVSDRALYEIYLPAFKAAVQQGKAWSIMGSYNLYRGIHVTHNPYLINNVLKGEWGFDGAVITDWGAAHDTQQAIDNGLDLEMGSYTNGLTSEAGSFGYDDYYLGKAYLQKVKNGEVSMDIVNDKAARMLRLLFRSELNGITTRGFQNTPEHVDANRRIAQEGIVLLKNEKLKGSNDQLLPIDGSKYNKILVVGDNATRSLTAGGGSSELKARDEVSPLRTLQNRYGSKVEYAQGYVAGPSMYGRIIEIPQAKYDELRAEAVAKAKDADLVIFVGGLNKNHFQDCEGGDRPEYNLPFCQNQLIEELLAVNPNTVVVIVSGNAFAMPWINQAPALVQSWYLGSQAGPALVDILSGDVNPSGKTVFSYPVALEDCPAHQFGRVGYPGVARDEMPASCQYGEGVNPASADLLKMATAPKAQGLLKASKNFGESVLTRNTSFDPRKHASTGYEVEVYAEDILVGYRWYDYHNINGLYSGKKSRVLFPFGYGLSYTTFEYSKPEINGRTVSVKVKNTGKVAGKEVVQFYVGDDKSSVVRPRKELKNFKKIALNPGEEKTVEYTIQDQDLQFFDEINHQWVSEPGSFTIYVAASSTDVRGTVKYTL